MGPPTPLATPFSVVEQAAVTTTTGLQEFDWLMEKKQTIHKSTCHFDSGKVDTYSVGAAADRSEADVIAGPTVWLDFCRN